MPHSPCCIGPHLWECYYGELVTSAEVGGFRVRVVDQGVVHILVEVTDAFAEPELFNAVAVSQTKL
jgi:hypothetical protein